MSVGEIEEALDSALVNLTSIDKIYRESAHYEKRKLIGPIYPEKFTFEELKVRTAKQVEVFKLFYLINNKLHGNKKGTSDNFYRLSQEVAPTGIEPISRV